MARSEQASRVLKEKGSGQERAHRLGRPRGADSQNSGNRTLVTGLNILKSIAGMDAPATLTALAQKNEMSITTVARYLASLTETGFLQQDSETGKFDLGPAAMAMGVATLARLDTVRLASDSLRDLTRETGHASILSVWSSHGPVVIRCEQGRLDFSVRVREGVYASVAATAAGRIFLAYWDSEEISPIASRDLKEWNKSAPSGKRLTMRDIEAAKQEILKHGLARSSGLYRPSLAALAAPVFGTNQRLLMSMTLVGMVDALDVSYTGEPAKALKAISARLSGTFGARQPGQS